MATYQANYSALDPVWGDIRFECDEPEAADLIAVEELKKLYPEYVDISVDNIERVND